MTVNKYSLLALSLAVAFGLAACGGEGGAKSAAEFKRANPNRIVIGNGVEPSTLDPQKSGEMAGSAVIRQMLSGLVGTDAEGKTIPALAERWENVDNKVWTFHLRDAKWSNGDPITAEDFVYSFRRLVDPATGSPNGSYLADAKVAGVEDILEGKAKPETLGVKALDAKTLQITLTTPVPYFADMLVQALTFPVHRATVEKYGDKWTQPEHYVTSGAYKPVEWVVNSHIRLERSPTFYDSDKVSIPEVVFLAGDTGNTEFNRYKANEVDITYGVPSAQIKTAEQDFPGQLKRNTLLCTWFLEPNHSVAPFNDVKVRRALNLLLDHDILTKVSAKGEPAAYQMTPPEMQGVSQVAPDWKDWSKEKRVEEAKKLLAEAGFSESKPLEFEVLYSTSELSKKQITAMQSLWKTAVPFIRPTMANQEWKTFLEARNGGKFTIAFAGWCSDYNDAAGMLNIFKANNTYNLFRYKSAEFDKLLAGTLADGVTPETRSKLYTEAEAVLQKDHAFMPIFHTVSAHMVKPDIRGFSDKDPLSNFVVKDWSFAKPE